jgi:predicted Fe-Mo cluster-binding NifX family protein
MDAVVKPERLEVVKKLVGEVRGVRSVHKARIRQSGPFYFVDLSIGVDKRVPVEQAHRLTEGIEQRIKDEFPFVESISVQIKPQEETIVRVAAPVLEDKGMDSQTTPHFGEAPYFLFVDIEAGEIQKWMTKPNPGHGLEKKRGITTAHLLVTEETTTLLTGQLGEGPFHYLRDSFIEIYEIPKSVSVSEALETYLAGTLSKMETPTKEER